MSTWNAPLCEAATVCLRHVLRHVGEVSRGTEFADAVFLLPFSVSKCIKGRAPSILSSLQGVQYKCQYCDKAFATQNSRLAHEREVHRGRSKVYKCRHCGKMCTKSRIKRHEMAHRHQYKCPQPGCERIFKMKKVRCVCVCVCVRERESVCVCV